MRRVGLCLGWIALTCACVGSGVAGKIGASRPPKAEVLPHVTALGDAQSGGAVALARVDGRSVAFVLDQDDADLHAVDIDDRAELSVTDLGGTPSQLLVLPDGHLAVSLRDRSRVSLFEVTSSQSGALRWIGSFQTPSEPIGLAVTPDRSTLLVTSGWGHALSAYRLSDRTRLYEAPLPREPRAVVVSDDGSKAFVSHVVGAKLSVVDLADPAHPSSSLEMIAHVKKGNEAPSKAGAQEADQKTLAFDSDRDINPFAERLADKEHDRSACQGFALAKSTEPAGRILAPEVLVDPGDGTERSEGYGSASQPTEVGNVAVIDAETGKPLEASLHPLGAAAVAQLGFRGRSVSDGQQDCLLPRAAAYDAKSSSLFVACLGIDTIVEYDASSADPHSAERRRWRVASGPVGVAVDGDKHRLVVWSQFDRAITFLPYDDASLAEDGESTDNDPPAHVMLALSRKPATSTADVALGRKLFHAAGDRRISADGRACASCHPDGRDDSLTWATPDGPRNTPMLAGRIEGTAPYGWRGANDDVRKHLTQTFQRLRGVGFEGRELDALMAYVKTMPVPGGSPDAGEAARSVALVRHGEELFRSEETGCAGCHNPAQTFTDGMKHDVGSAVNHDVEHDFDTPSLRYLAGTAPYFHDGRFATLHDLLTAKDSKMGNTAQLAPGDVDALEAYLRTL